MQKLKTGDTKPVSIRPFLFSYSLFFCLLNVTKHQSSIEICWRHRCAVGQTFCIASFDATGTHARNQPVPTIFTHGPIELATAIIFLCWMSRRRNMCGHWTFHLTAAHTPFLSEKRSDPQNGTLSVPRRAIPAGGPSRWVDCTGTYSHESIQFSYIPLIPFFSPRWPVLFFECRIKKGVMYYKIRLCPYVSISGTLHGQKVSGRLFPFCAWVWRNAIAPFFWTTDNDNAIRVFELYIDLKGFKLYIQRVHIYHGRSIYVMCGKF